MVENFNLEPIGYVVSPYETKEGTPVQHSNVDVEQGKLVVYDKYIDGLKDIDGLSHLMVLFRFNRHEDYALECVPYLDTEKRGIFSTRSPKRPNQIGLSIVKVTSVTENSIGVSGLDMLNNTPIIDIKPYLPSLNPVEDVRVGWYEGKLDNFKTQRADTSF